MANSARFFGLIPAGGVGSRFGGQGPKQYARLGVSTVLEHSVQALLADPRIERVFVVLAQGDSLGQNLFRGHDKVECLPLAGAERYNTVLNALNCLLEDRQIDETDWVLVHDAARPGLSCVALSQLIDRVGSHEVGGLLALPVVDTLKRSAQGEDVPCEVQETVPRRNLWAAQTPQMFRAKALCRAIGECISRGVELTDDASAMEIMDAKPLLVPGHIENMKITLPNDLQVLTRLLGMPTGSHHD